VYAETGVREASAAADSAAKTGIAGVVVSPGDEPLSSLDDTIRRLRTTYPKVAFLLANPNAIQPEMKGTLVINRDGILQVTSPTAQPWVDTNLALVRLEQAFRPAQVPLYSFRWNLTGAAQQQGPDVPDYALAVAEAAAFGADLILALHQNLEGGLAHDDSKAWATWDQVKQYVRFFPAQRRHLVPEANVAVITAEDPASFEPINLLARHNIGVRVLKPNLFNEFNLQHFDVAVVLSTPTKTGMQTISHFAGRGGTVVLVNANNVSYPWHSARPLRTSNASVSYSIGKGRIIELSEPIADPETFAQDVRRLIENKDIRMSLWNALTTIAVLYRGMDTGDKIVELLNYAEDPLEVQIRVKGAYSSVRYETPEHDCCETLKPVIRDGFTEFLVPSVYIAGRVHLKGKVNPPTPANK